LGFLKRENPINIFRRQRKSQKRKRGEFLIGLLLVLWAPLFLFSCAHTPEDPLSQEMDKFTQVFDASEKVIVRAVTQVLKERGFGQAKVKRVGEDQSRLETEYVPQGDWRTKMEVTIKKISRKEREVTLLVTTEQKDSGPSGWKARKLLGKGQYEKIFNEIEMQIYREWAKGE
jgi:hypothetical protein